MEMTKGDAKEFELCDGGVEAGFDQFYLLAQALALQFNELNAIANCADWAGQIMAHAGCDKGCYIEFLSYDGFEKEDPWKI